MATRFHGRTWTHRLTSLLFLILGNSSLAGASIRRTADQKWRMYWSSGRDVEDPTPEWEGLEQVTPYHVPFGPSVFLKRASSNGKKCGVIVPYWNLIALFLIPYGVLLRRRLKMRQALWRMQNRQCVVCGYDVRGVVQCPECGTAVPSRDQVLRQLLFRDSRESTELKGEDNFKGVG